MHASCRLPSCRPSAAHIGRVSNGSGRRAAAVLPARAQKRVIERAYFQDVFSGAADRIFMQNGYLKLEETLVMVESVDRIEHCYKVMDLIAKHLENVTNRDGKNDWHHRKKYYRRLFQQALRFERGADVVFGVFGNMERFRVMPYFAKETINEMGAARVHPGLLMRIAELTKLQRGQADKGTRMAYSAVVDTLSERDGELDKQVLAQARPELKACYAASSTPGTTSAGSAAPAATDTPEAAPASVLQEAEGSQAAPASQTVNQNA